MKRVITPNEMQLTTISISIPSKPSNSPNQQKECSRSSCAQIPVTNKSTEANIMKT